MDKLFEKTLSSKNVYQGKLVDIELDEVELSNGKRAMREVCRHAGGVVILALKDEKILAVKQFRYPNKEVMIELPAGKLEKNEDPTLAASRELIEETGYKPLELEYLGYVEPSPGFLDEKLHLFYTEKLEYVGQNLDEDEFLDFLQIPKCEFLKLIKDGIINDSKTICAITRGLLL